MRKQIKNSDYKTSWLELFFDLVFVALVAQLTYHFSFNHSLFENFLQVGLVGYMIFFAWIGTTRHQNIKQQEDLVDVLSIQAQMLLIMTMTISLPQAFGDYSWLFFGAMATNSLIVLNLARRHTPANKSPSPTLWAFGIINASLWGIAGCLPVPYLYIVAGCALLMNIFGPLTAEQESRQEALNLHHLLERLGLFLLLVMGEAVLVVAIANSTAGQFELYKLLLALSGLLLMIALWWLYFPYIDDLARDKEARWFQLMLQTHGFLYGSLILIATGLKVLIESPSASIEKAWLFVSGVALLIVTFNIIRAALHHGTKRALLSTIIFLVALLALTIACTWWQWPAYIMVPAVTALLIGYVVLDYRAHFAK